MVQPQAVNQPMPVPRLGPGSQLDRLRGADRNFVVLACCLLAMYLWGERIRTSGLYVLNVALYQAKLNAGSHRLAQTFG